MTHDALSRSRPVIAGLRLLVRVRTAVTRLVEMIRRLDSSMTAVLDCRRCRGSDDPPAPGGCC